MRTPGPQPLLSEPPDTPRETWWDVRAGSVRRGGAVRLLGDARPPSARWRSHRIAALPGGRQSAASVQASGTRNRRSSLIVYANRPARAERVHRHHSATRKPRALSCCGIPRCVGRCRGAILTDLSVEVYRPLRVHVSREGAQEVRLPRPLCQRATSSRVRAQVDAADNLAAPPPASESRTARSWATTMLGRRHASPPS